MPNRIVSGLWDTDKPNGDNIVSMMLYDTLLAV
jgi:hypothetical protein